MSRRALARPQQLDTAEFLELELNCGAGDANVDGERAVATPAATQFNALLQGM